MLAGNGDDGMLGSRGHAVLGMDVKEYVRTIRLAAHVAQVEVGLVCKTLGTRVRTSRTVIMVKNVM
jgi:hypothetical protein